MAFSVAWRRPLREYYVQTNSSNAQHSLQRLFAWVLRPLEVWPPPSGAIDIPLLIEEVADRPTRIKVTRANHPVTLGWGGGRENPDNGLHSLSIRSHPKSASVEPSTLYK
ncbi:hypothetical protein MHYP_G00334840 [Metynnis hypsauchen]